MSVFLISVASFARPDILADGSKLNSLKVTPFIAAQSTFNNAFLQLVVDKSSSSAYLMTWPESAKDPVLIRQYPVGLGKTLGDKQYEGDHKTPEGVYFTRDSFAKPTQYGKFGPLVIPLNYPNILDISENKTGSGIWLHGVGLDRSLEDKYITEGCVAFGNSEIEGLQKALLPYQSVVIITENMKGVNSKKDLKNIEGKTRAWEKAWNARDIDRYQDFYADDFYDSQKGHFKQYIRYKRAVFNRYRKMVVRMDHIRSSVHPKYAVSIMLQYFKGDDHLESQGTKILYWKKNSDSVWKIFREDYNTANFHPQQFVKIDHRSNVQAPL